MEKINTTQVQELLTGHIQKGEFTDLTNAIDTMLKEFGDECLLVINQILALPFNLYALTNHLLKKEELLIQVLKDSYYHENGFHKIVLLNGKYFKLRLHHFGSSAKIPMENVHDHRWAFASSILSGTLNMEVLKVSEKKGELLLHYVYDSDKSSGKYNVEFKGFKYVRLAERRKYNRGDQYLMKPDELHRIINQPGQESMTLILTGNPVGNTCNLYAAREIKEEEKKAVRYLKKDLVSMLKYIINQVYIIRN